MVEERNKLCYTELLACYFNSCTHEGFMNTSLPNAITLLRILLAPVLVAVYYLPFAWSHIFAALIFIVAGASDWLDGYLARAYSLTSRLGAFLDPVADKIIVAVALVLLVGQPGSHLIVIPAMVIIVREIIVSGLREWMAEVGSRASVAVSYIGKCKTAFQMMAIAVLIICSKANSGWLFLLGNTLLYLSALLTLWSMMLYLKAAWPEFERPS